MIKPLPQDDLLFIASKLSGVIKKFHNQHLLITGATGFIGSWLLEFFIDVSRRGNINLEITIITRDKKKFINNYPYLNEYRLLNIIEGDIRKPNLYNLDKNIDYIIHAATDASDKLNKETPLLMSDVIVQGTRNILELASKHKIKKILFLSSGAVYRNNIKELSGISEDSYIAPDCNNPASSYGESKRYAELLFAIYHQQFNIPYTSARCFAFVGPRLPLDKHFAIGNFINNILNDEDIIISGDGKSVRSYLYIADLVVWLIMMLTENTKSKVFNVGSNKNYTIEEIAQKIINITKSNRKYQILNLQSGENIYTTNINKILDELSVKIFHNIESSIIKTINYNKD